MSEGTRRGTVIVEVELTEPLLELIQQVKEEQAPLTREEPKPIEEWVREAALLRLRLAEGKHEVPVTADVPEEAVEKAKLHAEDREIRTGEDADFRDWVPEFIDLQSRYEGVDEEPPEDGGEDGE